MPSFSLITFADNPYENREDQQGRFLRALWRMRECEARFDDARRRALERKRYLFDRHKQATENRCRVTRTKMPDEKALWLEVERMQDKDITFTDAVGDIQKYSNWFGIYANAAMVEAKALEWVGKEEADVAGNRSGRVDPTLKSPVGTIAAGSGG